MAPAPVDRFRRDTARRLRKNATDAELILWRHLRRLVSEGSHFRRQAPIGRYVVDFACMAACLVIEVDGSQHGEENGRRGDETRTRWLKAEGFLVLRFRNNEVMENIDGVLDVVYAGVHGSRDVDPSVLKHTRQHRGSGRGRHPTPPVRCADARPSPSRGG